MKTRERKEDYAPEEIFRDISSVLVVEHPIGQKTCFGDEDFTEPPALAMSSDDALVGRGAEASKPHVPPVEMRTSTPAGGSVFAGSASTTLFVPHSLFFGAFAKRLKKQ